MRPPALVFMAIVLIAPAVFGQSINPASPAPGNPGGMPPGTSQSAPGVAALRQTNQPDRAFIRAAAVGGLAEVELGRLAAGLHSLQRSHAMRVLAEPLSTERSDCAKMWECAFKAVQAWNQRH
jgi:hypothetical protein